jgi:hypothetical protein
MSQNFIVLLKFHCTDPRKLSPRHGHGQPSSTRTRCTLSS